MNACPEQNICAKHSSAILIRFKCDVSFEVFMAVNFHCGLLGYDAISLVHTYQHFGGTFTVCFLYMAVPHACILLTACTYLAFKNLQFFNHSTQ